MLNNFFIFALIYKLTLQKPYQIVVSGQLQKYTILKENG